MQVATLCTKIIRIQVSRVDPIYCDIFGPAERVRYMTSRLIGDISNKGVQHYRVVTYLCGPPTMTEAVAAGLQDLGMQRGDVKYENWW